MNFRCEHSMWLFLSSHWQGIVSVLAFLVAFLTLYYTQLQSFKPKIYSTGRYILSKNDANPNQLAVTFLLNFSNLGARAGIIENIYLKFNNYKGTAIFLIPRNVLSGDKASGFRAFSINPKETISKAIMFVPYLSSTEFSGVAGEYEVEVYVKTSKSDDWKRETAVKIEIDANDLGQIDNNVKIGSEGFNMSGVEKITVDLNDDFKKISASINNSK